MGPPARPHRRRRALLATACLALVAVVAGCGGDGDPTPSGAAAGPDGTTSAGGRAVASTTDGAPAPATDQPPPRQFTLAAAGDLLIHLPVARSAQAAAGGTGYDFGALLAPVAPTISAADWAICHQEGPISYDSTDLSGYPLFNAPREVAAGAVAAGFDACEATSNHSIDRGTPGVIATLDVFDEVGLAHTGTGRTAEEQAAGAIYDVAGVRVGHLAYTYSFNGNLVPADAPWLGDALYLQRGVDGVLDDAAALRSRGAEVVVLSMQWGIEYQQAPSAEQQQWARDLLASPDVDLILGDHVHVVQPCEVIGGKVVHYGMGNLLSNQGADAGLLAATQDGVVVTYELTEQGDGGFAVTAMTYTPTFVEHPGHRVVPATPATHPASYERTVAAMGALGPDACPAVPAF